MTDDPANPEMIRTEELVAYLDGELDADSARRIERLLANDSQVRRQLQELERTWNLLDELEGAQVGSAFTQSTLEMVAVAAEEDVRTSQAALPRLRRRRWLLAGGIVLGAALAGFLTVALAAPNPNRQLLRDLPVLENLDQYRQVDSVEFLRLLRREKLFPEEEGTE